MKLFVKVVLASIFSALAAIGIGTIGLPLFYLAAGTLFKYTGIGYEFSTLVPAGQVLIFGYILGVPLLTILGLIAFARTEPFFIAFGRCLTIFLLVAALVAFVATLALAFADQFVSPVATSNDEGLSVPEAMYFVALATLPPIVPAACLAAIEKWGRA